MKRILQTLAVAVLLTGAQSAWSIVRDRHEWIASPLVESPYPADAEASFALPPFGSYVDEHKGGRQELMGDPFPFNLGGVMIDG